MSNEVTLEFTDTTVALESVGGSSAADVASAIATHNSDTTAVHGITDTSALDTVTARNAAIAAIYSAAGVWTAGQSFRAETVYQKAALAAGDFTPFSIDPQDAGARDWNFNIGAATFPGDPSRPDVIMNWGYNNGASGGCDDVTDDAFYLQMESYYAQTATKRVFEYHLNYYGPNHANSFRPFQINVERHDSDVPLHTTHYFNGDSFLFQTRDGSKAQFVVTGNVFTFHNAANDKSLSLYFDAQTHVDGSGYLQLFGFSGFILPDPLGVMYANANGWDGAPNINLSAGNKIKVNSVAVLGARVIDARLADTPNSGDATTDGLIDALRDLVIAHGLGAAA